jgi:hypothetical protein
LADLSYCRFIEAIAPAASFERAALTCGRMEKFGAEDAIFEFADLRGVVMLDCNFRRANFVGAALAGARAFSCHFEDADFYWAEMEGFERFDCHMKGARFPEKVKIAYGPKGVKPPEVIPVPLYRKAATEEERKKLLEAVLEIPPPEERPK